MEAGRDDPEEVFIAMHGRVVPKRKGWLSRIAVDRTAFMKNLPHKRVPQKTIIPKLGWKETMFECEPGARRRAIVFGRECNRHQHLGTVETALMTERMKRREAAETNWHEDHRILSRMSADEKLSDCSWLVIDRRPSTMELVFAPLQKILNERSDFLAIFDSSAVMWDRDKLKSFFSACKIFTVLRKISPVKILHLEEPTSDYLSVAAFLVYDIQVNKPIGDIIIFLAGEEEFDPLHQLITELMRLALENAKYSELSVFPVYHGERNDPKLLVPEPKRDPQAHFRKVYLTTDKADAMFNFDKISYVIDCGFETRVAKNRKLETNSLEVAPISQDLAAKRATRAGRAGLGGMCYRLYTEAAYLGEMCPKTEPEVMRANFSEALLLRDALGLPLINCLDCPAEKSLVQGAKQLWYLEAFNDNLRVTPLGKDMAEFPVQPVLANILIAASLYLHCSQEASTIVAMVLTGNVFERSIETAKMEAVLNRAHLSHPEGDHLTRLEIFEAWGRNGFSREWCEHNFIMYKAMVKAREIKNQLISIMIRHGLGIVGGWKDYSRIRKAVAAGLFFHSAKWEPLLGCYLAESDNRKLHINPLSALFLRRPSCVVFDDLHVTSSGVEYMIGVTEVDHLWLLDVAPKWFFKRDPMMRVVNPSNEP